jgi:transcriptional regulator with XRE-family HTH domain
MRIASTLPDVAQVDPGKLGEEIRAERLRQGLSQAELAARVNRDQSVVSTVESGGHGLRIVLLDQLARALLGPKGLGILLLRAGALDLEIPVEELLGADPGLSDDSRDLMRRLYERAKRFDQEEGAVVSPPRAPRPEPADDGA